MVSWKKVLASESEACFYAGLNIFKGATRKSVSECNLWERRIKPGMNLM
jgi:hypothetical protein